MPLCSPLFRPIFIISHIFKSYNCNINRSGDAPFLTKKNNKLIITDYERSRVRFVYVEDYYESGHLIAINYGEFGRSLYYVSTDDFYEVDALANDFYILNDNHSITYCVFGLGHLSISEGKITKVIKVDGKWQKDISFEIDLEDCIYAFYVEDDTVYVVTTKKLITIKDDKIEKILLENAFWDELLYPNSIVKIEDKLYIGMRGGIASYALKTGELLWYEQTTD